MNYGDTHITKFPREQKPVPVPVPRGSTMFFGGNLIHGSGPNRTKDRFRRTFIGHYIDEASDQVGEILSPGAEHGRGSGKRHRGARRRRSLRRRLAGRRALISWATEVSPTGAKAPILKAGATWIEVTFLPTRGMWRVPSSEDAHPRGGCARPLATGALRKGNSG